jgi:predicted Zn finger-like uncharacterized protein
VARLSQGRLESLLPGLPVIAQMVRSHGPLSEQELAPLLWGLELDADPDTVKELELWSKILATLRPSAEPVAREVAKTALLLRGVPEANAELAIISVAGASSSPSHQSQPIRVRPTFVSLDALPPGQPVIVEITASGGPGWVRATSDALDLRTGQFGPEETRVIVYISSGVDGQVLYATIFLESASEIVQVDVTARWLAPPAALTMEKAIAAAQARGLDAEDVEAQIKQAAENAGQLAGLSDGTKRVLLAFRSGTCDVCGFAGVPTSCPNCDHVFEPQRKLSTTCVPCPSCKSQLRIPERANGARVRCPGCKTVFVIPNVQCPSCEWRFAIDDAGVVVGGLPLKVTCPKCSTPLKGPDPGQVRCPFCNTEFQVDERGNRWEIPGKETSQDPDHQADDEEGNDDQPEDDDLADDGEDEGDAEEEDDDSEGEDPYEEDTFDDEDFDEEDFDDDEESDEEDEFEDEEDDFDDEDFDEEDFDDDQESDEEDEFEDEDLDDEDVED